MAEYMEQKKKVKSSETPIERDGRDSDVDGDEKDDEKAGQIVLERRTTTPGIVYLSRIPPFMKPIKVKQLLSEYGEIGRVFLQPEGRYHWLWPTGETLATYWEVVADRCLFGTLKLLFTSSVIIPRSTDQIEEKEVRRK